MRKAPPGRLAVFITILAIIWSVTLWSLAPEDRSRKELARLRSELEMERIRLAKVRAYALGIETKAAARIKRGDLSRAAWSYLVAGRKVSSEVLELCC